MYLKKKGDRHFLRSTTKCAFDVKKRVPATCFKVKSKSFPTITGKDWLGLGLSSGESF